MRYAFIAENRLIFAVRAMCRMLAVHPSGFYAWLREPFCQRALEDQRQTVLLKQAWDDSGEVYGYRKLHDDLCDLGEDISPNRAWRLARLVIPPFLAGCIRRIHAAIFSFCAGVMPPMPMFGRSLL